ncbi:unnamed protein product [Brassica napus]|uniref:(rape) hypothetical protein n=1 Tax=Brassica napus TaxID=3708 RepID=A0A817AAL4_BRANA|nr:unnamed protein product [Brassica napus]
MFYSEPGAEVTMKLEIESSSGTRLLSDVDNLELCAEQIHLDLLWGGLDPRLVTLDWSISEAVGVWGDSESAFWCSDPDLSFAFVDLWCERRLRRVLFAVWLRGFSCCFRSVSCFVVEWGSKLSQDGDLASRSVKDYVLCSGVMMAALPCQRVRWILMAVWSLYLRGLRLQSKFGGSGSVVYGCSLLPLWYCSLLVSSSSLAGSCCSGLCVWSL